MHRLAVTVSIILIALPTIAVPGTESNLVETVNAFRAARDSGNYELARTFLSDSPRVWYDSREGEGYPLKLRAGRWKIWDEHFNGSSELGPWTVEAGNVWAVARETNDYFRLLEREDISRYRITYFFNGEGKIEGYMISAAHPGQPSRPRRDRFEEFEAWAVANHQQEWEYLRPGAELDPTGDRAPRTRLLLEAWREEVGLPVMDGGKNSHGVFTGEQKSVLYVADVQKSAEFFEKVLGFDFDGFAERNGVPYYAEMISGGTKFGLHEPTSPGQESRIGEQRLYFRVRDLSAHRVRVAARGGDPGKIKKTDWMDMFVVRDPDGHEIVFAFTDPDEHTIDPW